MIWVIMLADGTLEYVQCQQAGVTPDGSLIFSNGPNNIEAIYNINWWRKVNPSAVQIKAS